MSGRQTKEVRLNNDGVRDAPPLWWAGGVSRICEELSTKCVLRARRDLPSRLTRFAPVFALRLRDGDPLF
jgi:hypothetical protein